MDGICITGYGGKYTIFPDGNVVRNPSKYRKTTMTLKPKKGRYLRVALYGASGRREFSIHRLVAMHFVPNPLNLPWVNHIDGNTHNNRASNLEWVTPSENEIHSIAVLGRVRNTQKQRSAASLCGKNKRKLSMEDAEHVRQLSRTEPRKLLAKRFGVSLSVIDCIVTGKRYKQKEEMQI